MAQSKRTVGDRLGVLVVILAFGAVVALPVTWGWNALFPEDPRPYWYWLAFAVAGPVLAQPFWWLGRRWRSRKQVNR